MGDDTVGTDGSVIADGYLAKDFCTRTDVDIIANCGDTCPLPPPTYADCDVMGEVAIFADLHILISHNPTVMTDVKTWPNFGFEGNGDAIFDLEAVIDQPGKREKDAPQWVGMGISSEPHPPRVSVSGREQVVIEVIF